MTVSVLPHNLWMNGKSVHGARCPFPECRGLNSILVKPGDIEKVRCKHFERMVPERPAPDNVVRFYFEPR